MEKFTQEMLDSTFTKYKINEKVEGVIVLINSDGFVVNIGGKKDAFIYNEDILDKESFNVGNTIKGIITSIKDENGFVRINQKEYEERKQCDKIFNDLHIGSQIEVEPTMVTTGGLLAKFKDFNVFIPNSHLEFKYKNNSAFYVNKKINVNIIQMEFKSKKIVASIKKYIEQEREEQDNEFWSKIQEGLIYDGTVKKTMEFGAFITIMNHDCLLLNKDIGYFNEKPQDVFNVGDIDKFIVLKLDRENNKVLLGYKQLKDDPRIELYKKYEVEKNYVGKVVKLFNFGAVIEFEPNVAGFLHISDAEYGLIDMHEQYKIGQEVLVKVKEINLKTNKISLEKKYDYEYEIN